MKHLVKYLKTEDIVLDKIPIQRREWFEAIIDENSAVLFNKKFKVFNDKSIEIPINFKDDEFDEFLYEVGKRNIYDFIVEPQVMQRV